MRCQSNIIPDKFIIENIKDGKCDIIFNDNIEKTEVENEVTYSFDTYRLNINYRDGLQELLIDENEYKKFLEYAKQIEYDKLAKEVREKRNKLLEESDKYMAIDRLGIAIPENITTLTLLQSVKDFFLAFKNVTNGEYAKYRQELRDLTKQEGFPYNVEFPNKPTE